jgi:hypothetical protein
LIILTGCGVYSLSGISINYDQVKTITINMFFNETGQGPPTMSQEFTETLRDYFIQNTQLSLTPASGDLVLEGSIVSYNLTPVAPTGTLDETQPETASLMRLTLGVSVTYINSVDESFNFENKRFSFYEDYDPDRTDLTVVEDELINTIFNQIVFDIFNATVANW